MQRIIALAGLAAGLATGLAGCVTRPSPPLPPVSVSGPVFPASQFEFQPLPLPPDPAAVGAAGGSAAARYESRLRSTAQLCHARLGSVGRQLDAAGLVVRLKQGAAR